MRLVHWTSVLVFGLLVAGNALAKSPPSDTRTSDLPFLEKVEIGATAEQKDEVDYEERYDVRLHLRNGKEVTLLKDTCDHRATPEMSPDKRFVAVAENGRANGLFLVSTDDGRVERHVLAKEGSEREIHDFSWSPDSRGVAFAECWNLGKMVSDPPPYYATKLFICDIGEKKHVAVKVDSVSELANEGCFPHVPVWSADGRKVAILESNVGRGFQVTVFDRSGKRLAQAKLPPKVVNCRLTPRGGDEDTCKASNGARGLTWVNSSTLAVHTEAGQDLIVRPQ